MIDAYTHLDMTTPDPERLIVSRSPQFRVALCFRAEESSCPPLDILQKAMVAALRVKTADLRRLGNWADRLEESGKWLLPHAEYGIKRLTDELLPVVRSHPGFHIDLPHLGWPRSDKQDDKDWEASIVELNQLPFITVGISAIAHFSHEPYPHKDVEPFAGWLLQAFGQQSVLAGADYPLIEKSMYAEYLKLVCRWIRHTSAAQESDFENMLFDGTAKVNP